MMNIAIRNFKLKINRLKSKARLLIIMIKLRNNDKNFLKKLFIKNKYYNI